MAKMAGADMSAWLHRERQAQGKKGNLMTAGATLAALDAGPSKPVMDAYKRKLRGRYVDAFRGFHIDELVGLLHKDAVQSMPPYAMWVLGSKDIGRFILGPGHGCLGS